MILMAEVNGDGRWRRCTSRCHNGNPTTHCRCVCGGAFHGIGREKASELFRQKILELVTSVAKATQRQEKECEDGEN
jgi:hypothetical protein